MDEHKGDFDADLFNSLLTGPELAHVLYSDVESITQKLQSEFSQIITTQSIGKTWEERDITVITLDAR